MVRPQSNSDVAGARSSTWEGHTHPYRVTDLHDGAATLQLDVTVPWSTVLQVLKILGLNETNRPKGGL
jgi:hypothetical protein